MERNAIFVICGKSNSGKDTIMKSIMDVFKFSNFNLHKLPIHTTRPKRDGEVDGVEYVFDTAGDYEKYLAAGNICEERRYKVFDSSEWSYYTLASDIESDKNYVTINTPEAISKMTNYFKNSVNRMVKTDIYTIYIDCDDEELMERAMKREKNSKNPNYKEMARRFVCDAKDFDNSTLERLRRISVFSSFTYDQEENNSIETLPLSLSIMNYIVSIIMEKPYGGQSKITTNTSDIECIKDALLDNASKELFNSIPNNTEVDNSFGAYKEKLNTNLELKANASSLTPISSAVAHTK